VVAALVATIVVGGLIAAQPPINAELARRSSDIAAALLSVAISFVAIAILFLVVGDLTSLQKIRDAPPLYWTGGLFGALFVGVSLVTVRPLGAGTFFAALVSAQLIVGALLDHSRRARPRASLLLHMADPWCYRSRPGDRLDDNSLLTARSQ
jgi:transporter family-2 protein